MLLLLLLLQYARKTGKQLISFTSYGFIAQSLILQLSLNYLAHLSFRNTYHQLLSPKYDQELRSHCLDQGPAQTVLECQR
ncbi:hypothetical protein FKM82_021042 [Ascaphus truei]